MHQDILGPLLVGVLSSHCASIVGHTSTAKDDHHPHWPSRRPVTSQHPDNKASDLLLCPPKHLPPRFDEANAKAGAAAGGGDAAMGSERLSSDNANDDGAMNLVMAMEQATTNSEQSDVPADHNADTGDYRRGKRFKKLLRMLTGIRVGGARNSKAWATQASCSMQGP